MAKTRIFDSTSPIQSIFFCFVRIEHDPNVVQQPAGCPSRPPSILGVRRRLCGLSPGHVEGHLRQTLGQVAVTVHLSVPGEMDGQHFSHLSLINPGGSNLFPQEKSVPRRQQSNISYRRKKKLQFEAYFKTAVYNHNRHVVPSMITTFIACIVSI